jgi:hypothetical protein
MLILGNGMTAALALKVFPHAEAVVDKETISSGHKALLRFRSDAISKLTGIPFKKVTVYKGIWSGGEYINPNIKAMNMYSFKVTGGYADRSIANCQPAERFIAPVDFGERLINSVQDRIFVEENICQFSSRMSMDLPIITTLQMKKNHEIFPINDPVSFDDPKYSSIYVNRYTINGCDLYQTVYYPDSNTHIYRATVEGDQLIIESIYEIDRTGEDIGFILKSLGINSIKEHIIKNYKQTIGKMIKIDEVARQKAIAQLTMLHNVYSLGRVACWRPSVLLDNVLKDLYIIRDMIELTPYERAMRWK